MRLLSTTEFSLTDFPGRPPYYAILSHTWGNSEEEVNFKDLKNLTLAKEKKAWSKIEGCCRQAKADGFDWVWIDSSNIDKSSSAELSEAINSMFSWYEQAVICYVYLEDVADKTALKNNNERHSVFDINMGLGTYPASDLKNSKWFGRGWTLQELIAPRTVVFYDKFWNEIGTKASMSATISDITSIPESVLVERKLKDCNAAEKMAWASTRQTTRLEDQAYCLLGIFGVHMPLLYGEKENAFFRLQLEVLKTGYDFSIYAWKHSFNQDYRPLLASSPDQFCRKDSCDIHWGNENSWTYASLESAPLLLPSLSDVPVQHGNQIIVRLPVSRFPHARVFLNCHITKTDPITKSRSPIAILCSEFYNSKSAETLLGNQVARPMSDLAHLDISNLRFQQKLAPDIHVSTLFRTASEQATGLWVAFPTCMKGDEEVFSPKLPFKTVLRHNHEGLNENLELEAKSIDDAPFFYLIVIDRDGLFHMEYYTSGGWTDRATYLTKGHRRISVTLKPAISMKSLEYHQRRQTLHFLLQVTCEDITDCSYK